MSKQFDLHAIEASASLPSTPITVDLGAIFQYVLHWARRPDPGSAFARATIITRYMSDSRLLTKLHNDNYGGHLLFHEGKIIGHLFYQQHGTDVRMFSIEVDPLHRNKGWANKLMYSFLDAMGLRYEIEYIRLGAGNDDAVVHMYCKALAGEYDVGYQLAFCDDPNRLIRWSKKPLPGWMRIER